MASISNISEPRHWYVAVPHKALNNFQLALKEKTWGAKERQKFGDAAAGEISAGDVVHFILEIQWDGEGQAPKGFNRVLSTFIARARELVVDVVSDVFEEASPLWPDNTYPARFRFEPRDPAPLPIHLNPETVSDEVRDAIRQSGIQQGRAMLAKADPVPGLSDLIRSVLAEYPEARSKPFPQHALRAVVLEGIPNRVRQMVNDPHRYRIDGSVGQGNWANVPWVVIRDKDHGGTIREGLYVAMLFPESGKGVVLALMFGVEDGGSGLSGKVAAMRSRMQPKPPGDWTYNADLQLATTGIGQRYSRGIIAYRTFSLDSLPSQSRWAEVLSEALTLYQHALGLTEPSPLAPSPTQPSTAGSSAQEESAPYGTSQAFDLVAAHSLTNATGYRLAIDDLLNVILALYVRPFAIFSGRSGTGKTTLSRIIADLFGWHYQRVAVSPAWADPADLLGYVSPLNQGFVAGALSDLFSEPRSSALVCLDEFNVAKVEHYFSDFISAMDSGEDGHFWGPLANLPRLSDPEDRVFQLPSHLMVVATMNFDDSVQSITPRVLDRANVIEFDIAGQESLVLGSAPTLMGLRQSPAFLWPWSPQDPASPNDDAAIAEEDWVRTLWQALRGSRGQFGHRVAQEIVRYVVAGLPFAETLKRSLPRQLDALRDRQIVQRLLPKFHGSATQRDIQALMRLVVALMDGTADFDLGEREALMDQALNQDRFPKTLNKIQQLLQSYTEDGYAAFF